MYLKEFLTEDVVTIQAEASTDDAIKLMAGHRVRHLPVVRDGKAVGMVSLGDVLGHVGGLLSEDRVSTQDPTVAYAGPIVVDQIMSSEVVTLSPEDTAAEACRVMLEQGIAGVVVVSDGSIVGIVTEADFLRRFFDASELVPGPCRQQMVADHMTTEVVTARPRENVFELIRKMAKRMHHLPVVDNGVVVGMVSDHDVRRALALDDVQSIKDPGQDIRLMADFDAEKIMARDVQTTSSSVTLADAARKMIENKVGSLPVVESEKLVAIITETDLLRACATALESC